MYTAINRSSIVSVNEFASTNAYTLRIYPDDTTGFSITHNNGSSRDQIYMTSTDIERQDATGYGWGGSLVTSLNTFLTDVTRCKQVQFKLASPVNITVGNVSVLSNFNIRASTLTDIFSNRTLKSLFQNTVIEGAICIWVAGGTAIARDLLVSNDGDKIGLDVHGWANSTCTDVRLLVFYRPK